MLGSLLFAVIAAPALGSIPGPLWLYAVLSLTLVRMVPVAISMLGLGLSHTTKLFLGWFGPRGLASFVLAWGHGYNGVFILCASASIVAMLVYLYMYLF